MESTITYELAVIALAYIVFRIYRAFAARAQTTLPANFAISGVQGAFLILGALGAIAGIAVFLLRDADAVTVCKQQEQTIKTAETGWETAVQQPFTAGTYQVQLHQGSTPGTFSNPQAAATDYLESQPTDPVNPTGLYSMVVVAKTTTSSEQVTITCPGVHSKADLASLSGASSATNGEVQMQNGNYSAI